ncbi:MAG TPA: LysM peptidoglycan-binding domain-containing protein [Methylomirabilota bacterium]|jgi:LysM repeat protein|nr:LysM peptidoglycan-binding domain-containing protein [Methylomirabilota bacterium]
MNNQSPLVPQGSMMEQTHPGRARVKLAVYFVLAVHGIGLMALLMQGCRREETTSQNQEPTNNVATLPPFDPAATQDPVASAAASATTNNPAQPAAADALPAQPPSAGSEYTIAQGDTYTTIGKKFHVSVRGLSEANPGVQPTRLRPGMKIHVPAAQAAPATVATAPAAKEATSGEQVYQVKSGDTLSKIATEHKTTVRAIRSANKLATDRITVGQKLKMPSAQAAPTTVATGPATPSPITGAQ